ncbi:MAG: lipid-A-disaccharide synthase [Desulfuromonadaceae bacterium]|nr:lipid-A-disaccharide synthase [Desulfuromonadaceae bacterium]MDD2854381.1 lipid-A-disaccharide synthase [Desulfuromonadaceae bacterium]
MIDLRGGVEISPPDTTAPRRVMIVAGEASGDIYGADLVKEALQLNSNIHFFGIGGARMREAGVETLVDSSDMAVMGLFEVFKHFRVISSAFIKFKRILLNAPPSLLILIDYPGFNVRLAKIAKKNNVKVLYYISPKVWAWKAGRIREIAASVSRMAVIFPFEVPIYEKAGVPVSFVGHPLLDLVNVEKGKKEAAANFDLDPSKTTIGLFPGSRKSEIERLLPDILAAAELLQKRFPNLQFVIPLASTLTEEDLFPFLKNSKIKPVITNQKIHDLIRASDAIISVSGTVTLEISLIGTPMVIIYKLAPLTYQVAKRVVKIKHIGLCNIVAEDSIVKELIQENASPENISAEIEKILVNETYRENMKKKLTAIRVKLGGGGASKNVAALAVGLLK